MLTESIDTRAFFFQIPVTKTLVILWILNHEDLGGVYMILERISFQCDTQSSYNVYIEVSILEWKCNKNNGGRKYESADQLNQSTWLILYQNELVPPLHDTGGTFGQISFWNESFDPERLPGWTHSGMTRFGMKFATPYGAGMNSYRDETRSSMTA